MTYCLMGSGKKKRERREKRKDFERQPVT